MTLTVLIAIAASIVVIGAVVFFLRTRERPDDAARALPEAARPEARVDRPAPTPAIAAPIRPVEPVHPAAEHAPKERIAASAPLVAPVISVAKEPQAARGASGEDLSALKKGLASTRGGFIARLAKLFSREKQIDPALFSELEEVLLTADLGVKTTEKMLARLRERVDREGLRDADRIWDAIQQEAEGILAGSGGAPNFRNRPAVVVVVGVNGVGKTTTIGKLASRFTAEGKKCVLAAGDTFRAAAVLQLEVWGRRVGCPVVKGKENGDPGAVVFDAIKQAKEDGADIVLVDTAGRLHTKVPLMEELKKLYRTAEKALEGAQPDEVLLVLDSTTGQNAIQQAQLFRDAIAVSGVVLTKLDGTAKGGVVLGIVDEHRVPVRYIGVGERIEDLRDFDAHTFLRALFERPDERSDASDR